MRPLTFPTLILLLASCSSQEPWSAGQGVHWESGKTKTLRLNKPTTLGPKSPNESTDVRPNRLVLALVLGPGLSRSVAHVALLKSLEKNAVSVGMITGHGLSAALAALYATGSSPQSIEWRYYKFMQKVKTIPPRSPAWHKALQESFVPPSLKNKNIQGHRIKLLIPVYNAKKQKVEYFSRGKIYPKLLDNLKADAAFKKQIFGRKEQLAKGADVIIGSDVLLAGKAGELSSVFAQAATRTRKEKGEVDWLFALPTRGVSPDFFGNMYSILQKSRLYSHKECQKLKTFITEWSSRQQ